MSDHLHKESKFPAWIEANIFENLLKRSHEDFAQIVEFSVGHALGPGDNYLSIMLKVEIIMKLKDDSTKPISFMLKIAPDSEVLQQFMQLHNIFTTEAGMYREIIPELEQLFAEVGVKVKFGPDSYELPVNEHYILLENLKVKGFKNTNRLDGLDRTHTESVLKKMAQWHAASAARVARKGLYPREYCTAYFKPEGYEQIKGMFDAAKDIFLECVREYTNSSLYYGKVAKLQNQITEEILKYTEPDLSEFNVLNHGDCWSNNIMFKYDDEGTITDTYLLDFQLPRYTSPALDLLTLLLSSTSLEIKLKEFDYFIKFYHEHLAANLKMLQYNKPIPSVRDIYATIYKHGIYGYLTTLNDMTVVLCDPTENATLDNFVDDSEEGANLKRQMYSNARYRAHMEALLPWMLHKGFLDC